MKDETRQRWAALMEQNTYTGPLCHMEEAQPLIPLRHPSPEALRSALADGRPVTLRPRDGAEETAAVADLSEERLNAALFPLSVRTRRQSHTLGWGGLCLAEGRLVSPKGISAPLLLWPVRLEQRREGWQLLRGGEGQRLNRPALERLAEAASASEVEWSRNPESLYRQIDALLADAPGWRRQDGAWLGNFPLWLLERPRPEEPLPEGSFGAGLQRGESFSPVPLPAPADLTGEEGLLAPLPLDGVQMTALHYVMEGNSLVVEGHRGTGKTQLAAAVMANAVGNRQRVLLTSLSESDRRSALERLKTLGLDRLCLTIPADGDEDQKRAVLHQFNVAAQLHPAAGSEDYFALASATLSLAGQLDHAAAELHTPCPCGLTAFGLICRYFEEREAEGYLPVPESAVLELDEAGLERRLDCIDELVETAERLKTPWDHPLAHIRADLSDPSQAAKLPETEQKLRSAMEQLDEAAWLWLAETGLERPVTREGWDKLRLAARLLAEWRELPDQWANSPRVPRLSDTVQELKSRTELVDQLGREIEEKWGENVLSLDAITLEQQWQFYKAEWTLPTEPDRESALRRLSVEAEALLNSLEQCGRRWAKCVDVPVPGTRDLWERYYEVAVELARWKEIPGEWGSCTGLQALLWDVGELIDVGKQARESKEVLLRDWTEDFLTLDGAALMESWQKEGGSWGLGWLTRQNATRTLLEPYCKSKMTTDLAESGLRWLVDYQEELAQCDEIYHRWEKELRSVYRREETVWVWLESARRVAAESHDWLTELTGSEDFLRKYGSSEEAVAAAEELKELWERSREVLGRLDVMIGRTGQPDGRDWLSDRRGDCRRLRSLLKIRKQMEERAKEPVPMGQIAEALAAIAGYQREEMGLEALFERWSREMSDLYEGTETDWEALTIQSLRAVESDDRIAELTGDLELRVRFARNEEVLAASEALADAVEAVQAAEAEMEALVSARLCPNTGDWLAELRENSGTIVAHLDELATWTRWKALCRAAEGLGLRAFVTHYESPVPEEEDTRQLFRKSLYRALVLRELERVPGSKQFSSRQLEETLGQYARLERRFTRRTREELFHVAAAHIPGISQDEELQEELRLLRWANRTGARDISLSGLLRGLPRLTALLFPCVVAGPADALRCFGGQAFDYVVLDRAEQIPLPLGQAVLGLGRTALLCSAGGRRMTHPLGGETESVLGRCQALGLPAASLEQCYLTRPESLGAWDVERFGISGIPTPLPQKFCIRYKTVVGRMDAGANPAEAAAVADQALQLRKEGSISVAVVAMTWEQAGLIRTLLRQSEGDEIPVMTPEEALCGKWQRVLLSLTLAADRRERLDAAREVLADWDGDYPISDALAAATEEVWLFSSLDEEDRPALEAGSPALARFLRYVREETVPPRSEPVRNRIQAELCEALNGRGYDAVPGPAPISVLASRRDRPELPPLGILLDDEDYGGIPRTRERELTRLELLWAQGWPLCRVWTLDWWRNRGNVLELLEQQLAQLQTPSETAPAPRAEPAEEAPLYAKAKLTVMGIRSGEVSSPAFQNRVYRVVEEILRQEAPMAVPQLTERMLKAFGLDDQDVELVSRCASLWPKLGLRITREEEQDYVWLPSQDPDRYLSFRRSGAGDRFRPPEYVSAQESANAACAVLKKRLALAPGELAGETARLLGYQRWDESALDCGRRGVEYALSSGRALETAVGSVVLDACKNR